MTTLNQPLTLEDYRVQVVSQLKDSTEPTRAADLLSYVETMLSAAQASRSLQRAFWRGLSRDLDLLAQQATLLEPAAAATLRGVIATARAVTARSLRLLQDVEW
jgi:hypothetical protein